MKDIQNISTKNQMTLKSYNKSIPFKVHPSWIRFIKYCRELEYGELKKLQIQDGLPAIAEYVKKKVKFI